MINRREIYEKALLDWSAPVTEENEDTHMGFCFYFWVHYQLELYNEDFEEIFPELYKQRDVDGEGGYHYIEHGHTKSGRLRRVEALLQAINELDMI